MWQANNASCKIHYLHLSNFEHLLKVSGVVWPQLLDSSLGICSAIWHQDDQDNYSYKYDQLTITQIILGASWNIVQWPGILKEENVKY